MKALANLVAAFLIMAPTAPAADPPRAAVDMKQRAEELKNLRWGMFICWSFSTFSGKEWSPGIKDVAFFKATGVDTDQWARTAKEAEMGYILFLAKHHDGFCLWDTETTDRKVTKAPLGRDVLAELRKSCDKHGIKLALYFSEGDWTWPGAKDGLPNGSGQDADKERAQLTELLTRYGPIEYLWVDHAAGTGGLSHAEFIAHCKKLQPGCFIGFNHGDQDGANIRVGEMGKPGPLDDHAAAGPHMRNAPSKDYLLAEFTYPILPPHEGGAMWFYSLPRHDGLVLPARKLYRDYLGAVKYGNIFSIDVGPDHEGKLRDIDVKTLREVGAMIRNKANLPTPVPCKASASSTWPAPNYEADKATDDDLQTRWGAAADSRSGWLEIAFDDVRTIRSALLDEGDYKRVARHEIQARTQDGWKTIATGTSIGADMKIMFPSPVKAGAFRLNILEASDVPTIAEFQLFE